MKKQSLQFQSEQEFQSFFAQLSSAEISDFQAIEGAGGDMGFDGLSGTTAYQVYFPDIKNRSEGKYIEKIDTDLAKVISNRVKLGLTIETWIFVVPEDLRIKVVAHLQSKQVTTGLKCLYWGSSKLTELITKYPHIQDSFPLIFLPPVRDGIDEIKNTLGTMITTRKSSKVDTNIEILGEDEFMLRYEELWEEYTQKKNRTNRFEYRGLEDLERVTKEFEQKSEELKRKREVTSRIYKLELEELNEQYDEDEEKINQEMIARGIYNSGIRLKTIERIEIKRNRDIDKLKIKYGVSGHILDTPPDSHRSGVSKKTSAPHV